MSLLNRPTTTVIVFPEENVTDEDGNIRTRPSQKGIECGAVIQPANSSIQPPGSGEGQSIGYESSEILRMRLVGWPYGRLGDQSQIEWQGHRYAVQGEAKQYITSSRTAHIDHTLMRR